MVNGPGAAHHTRYQSSREYKLVVVGSGGIGKSALTAQFIRNHFVEEYEPTIEDSYLKQCVVDGDAAVVNVLDTPGQEEHSAIQEKAMRAGDGFLLVYSITSRYSFEKLSAFYEQILRLKDQDSVPIIVVSTKCDLGYERQVGVNEGRDLAKHFGCAFIETSAKDCIHVDDTFCNLVREIRNYNKQTGRSTLLGPGDNTIHAYNSDAKLMGLPRPPTPAAPLPATTTLRTTGDATTMLLPSPLSDGPNLTVQDFCATYELDHAIHKRLLDNGYRRTRSFKHIEIEDLKAMGFMRGDIAELKEAVYLWAVTPLKTR